MADGLPPNLNSLRARIGNHAEAVGYPAERLQALLASGVVGRILTNNALGVVKGGRGLELRYGQSAARATTDLDAVVRERDDFLDRLRDAGAGGWSGFTLIVRDGRDIPAPVPADYVPTRFDVRVHYVGRPFARVPLEVAAVEIGYDAPPDTIEAPDLRELCASVGLPLLGPIATMPTAMQVAQKLHACTKPDSDDWVNDRAHDLVDLQILDAAGDWSDADVAPLVPRLFASRGTHAWPPVATVRAGWETIYTAEAEGIDVARSTAEAAVQWLNERLGLMDAPG